MKAIESFYNGVNLPSIIHNNVTEIESGNSNRAFKCLDCGRTWIETINSPQIITDNNIKEYHPTAKGCTKMRVVKAYFVAKNGETDTITTNINGTNEEINAYYLNKWFNIGRGGNDFMMKCTKVDFIK